MYQIFVTYHCGSMEDRDGFYRELEEKSIPRICREEKGCIRYDYYYPCGEDNKLFLLEQWETREDQQVHAGQPHFLAIGDLKKKYNVTSELEIMNAEKLG